MDIKIEELFPSSCEIKESGIVIVIVIIVNHDSRGSFQVNGNEGTFRQSDILVLGYN